MGYVFIEGEDIGDVRVYSLSTCAWCDKLKELLRGLGVRYSYIDLDTADEQEREEVLQFLDSIYEKWGFPALLFKDTFLVCGYNEKSILQTLGLEKGQSRPERHQPSSDEAAFDEKVEKTFETIRRFNEKKGYYLNPDTPFAKRLVRGLLENQEKIRVLGLSLQAGLGHQGRGQGYHLPLCVPGAGRARVRRLLLRPLCLRGSGPRSKETRSRT
jgi:glutaredoxin